MLRGYLDNNEVDLSGGTGGGSAAAAAPATRGQLDPNEVVIPVTPQAAAATQSALKPDDWLGFQQGFEGPALKVQKAVEDALATVPGMKRLGQQLGLPSTAQINAQDQAALAAAAQQGRRPGQLGQFVGGVAGNPFTYLGGPEAGWATNAALGAGGAALGSNAKTPGEFAQDVGLGAGFGLAAKPVGAAVGKVLGPALTDLQAAALKYGGWKPTPGQLVGGPQALTETATKNLLPWVGRAVNRSADTWDEAILNLRRDFQDFAQSDPNAAAAAVRADRNPASVPQLPRAKVQSGFTPAHGLALGGLGTSLFTIKEAAEPIIHALREIPVVKDAMPLVEPAVAGGMGAMATIPYADALQGALRSWGLMGRSAPASALRQAAPRATVGAAGAAAPRVRQWWQQPLQ